MKARYIDREAESSLEKPNGFFIPCSRGHPYCSKAFLMVIAIIVVTASDTLLVNAQVIPLPKWDDDDPLPKSSSGSQASLTASLEAQRCSVKLATQTTLAGIVRLETSKGPDTNSDIVCVIDVSGSMKGTKIELVKKTMKRLIQMLTPSDRLSIITFNHLSKRVTPLKAMTATNKLIFTKHIDDLGANGGTCIKRGLEMAIKTIRDRSMENEAASVFLLSDGRDGCKGTASDVAIADELEKPENKNIGAFTIDSLGFGDDYDEDVLRAIADLKDGSFLAVTQDKINDAFGNVVGAVKSLAASYISIDVKSVSSGPLKDVFISKVYGKNWVKRPDFYQIKQTQIKNQFIRDFLFEFTIPALPDDPSLIGEHVAFEARIRAKLKDGRRIENTFNLKLCLVDKNAVIDLSKANLNVIKSIRREAMVLSVNKSIRAADKKQFEEAKRILDDMIEDIEFDKFLSLETIDEYVKVLEDLKPFLSDKAYKEGRKLLLSMASNYRNQNGFPFQNPTQERIVKLLNQPLKPREDLITITVTHKIKVTSVDGSQPKLTLIPTQAVSSTNGTQPKPLNLAPATGSSGSQPKPLNLVPAQAVPSSNTTPAQP